MAVSEYDPVVKAKTAKTDKETIKEVSLSPTDEQLREFVGDIENLDRVECKRVYGNRYRINCWTKKYTDGMITPTIRLPYSWFVKYENETIIDITLSDHLS